MTRALLLIAAVCLLTRTATACCAGMVMNQLGLNLLENAEGFSATVYNDVAGNPTICYGHLIVPSDNFSPPLSKEQCQVILQQDLGSAQNCVQNAVQVPLNSNQFSALVDFAFNLGCGALQSSTLLRLLNQGQYTAVPAQMMRWDHAGGQVYAGLERRRQNEGILWNTPIGNPTDAPTTAAPTAGPTAASTAAPTAAASGCCAQMNMNAAGLQLLENAEGFSATEYQNPFGKMAICYGHVVKPSDNFSPPLSPSQCMQILYNDLSVAQSCVSNNVKVSLNTNQFSALVDFVYNLGCYQFRTSTLLRLLNQGEYSAVPAQIQRWVYSAGSILPGLVTRRNNEVTLWNTPVTGSTVPPTAAATTAAPPPHPPTTTGGGFILAEENTQAPAKSKSLSTMETALLAVGVAAGVVCVAVGVALRLRKRTDYDAPLLTAM